MKKLIAISVVFALVAGAAFAVDVGATVIGDVNVLKGDTGKDPAGNSTKVTSDGGLGRVRIDGSGEANENFGGYFRIDARHWSGAFNGDGNVWWKPIDQFKLLLGGNGGDGFFGKEGVTGWGFYQTPTDTGVTFGGANVWGSSIYGYGLTTRYAFYAGGIDGGDDAYLFITPNEMVGINIQLPFMSHKGEETADVFKQTIAQIDLKLDFGNIALTYAGGKGKKDPAKPDAYLDPGADSKDVYGWIQDPATGEITYGVKTPGAAATPKWKMTGGSDGYDDPASIFVYFGGSFGDLSIDFGLGYHMATHDKGEKGDTHNQPIGIGLGVKYAMETLGVKFRTVVALPMDNECDGMVVLADVQPYFVVSDNMMAFVSVGLGMQMPYKDQVDAAGEKVKSVTGWHFNPYLQIGEEWGAKFLAGIKVSSDGKKIYGEKGDATKLDWAIPIAMIVSF